MFVNIERVSNQSPFTNLLLKEKTRSKNQFQTMEKENSRAINCNFPARALVIDTTTPSCPDVIENIAEALSRFFALISEIVGHCRVPIFSLFISGPRSECFYPLQPVKGNFPKLYTSIQELKMQDHYGITTDPSEGMLQKTIKEAVSQFKRWSLTKKTEARLNACQIEICIITSKKQNNIEEEISEAFNDFDFEILKKIQVINIERTECGIEDKMKIANLSGDKYLNDSLHEYVEFSTLSNDVAAFEQTFKGWMIDIGTDDVHLTIDLPSVQGKAIQLKCDLEDRFLNPMCLPHCQQMFIRTGLQSCPQSYPLSRSINSAIPIVHLLGQKLIKSNGVCESLLFGQPLIVKPTSCWKLDWDDLDLNQQQFQVIRSFLKDKESVLLLATRALNSQAPIGFFVLLPSDGSSMLLKSVASNDLLLPIVRSLCMEKHSSIVRDEIEESIKLLPRSDILNPVELNSGIAKKMLTAKTRAGSKAAPKKRTAKELSKTSNVFQETQHWQRSKHYKNGL